MHAGFVDVPTLRRLEAAVWGDTASGGAVRVEVLPLGDAQPVLYDKQAEARKNHLPRTPDKKTTQGLWYQSYGMHDGGKQRHYLPPGTKWKLVLRARDGQFGLTDRSGKLLPATVRLLEKGLLLGQAQAALWWLCMVGGVGSKARKGFGNFCSPPELEGFEGGRFVSKGKELRAACGLADNSFKPEWSEGPALRQMVDLGRQIQPAGSGWVELVIPTTNIWQAIDTAGMVAQQFAKKYKHQREKSALGLPRRIGHPARGSFRPGPGVKDRHASPVHYHLHREGDRSVLRIAAFPAARLPSLPESEAMLVELLRHVVAAFAAGE
jgi:CRISPR-associated protein Cmr6